MHSAWQLEKVGFHPQKGKPSKNPSDTDPRLNHATTGNTSLAWFAAEAAAAPTAATAGPRYWRINVKPSLNKGMFAITSSVRSARSSNKRRIPSLTKLCSSPRVWIRTPTVIVVAIAIVTVPDITPGDAGTTRTLIVAGAAVCDGAAATEPPSPIRPAMMVVNITPRRTKDFTARCGMSNGSKRRVSGPWLNSLLCSTS